MQKSCVEKRFFLLLILFIISNQLPSKFDIRSIPSLSKFLNYDIKPQGICISQAWANQLAQALSHAHSMNIGINENLSARNIIQCMNSLTNKCHSSTLEDIHAGLKLIQEKGITSEICYPNRVMEYPRINCLRKCQDGYDFPYSLRGKVSMMERNNIQKLLETVGNVKSAVVVIYSITDEMNYYSYVKNNGGWDDSQSYGYGVGEIVGWSNYVKDVSLELTVKIGVGLEWGYMGFAKINIYKYPKWIKQIYEIKSPDAEEVIE